MAMSSTELLNLLVFRYLQESGFSQSALALGNEAGISRSSIDSNIVPPGALVTFVQKGIQYLEKEAKNDADINDGVSFLQPLDLLELQKIIKEKEESLQKTTHREMETNNDGSQSELDREHALERKKEHEPDNAREQELIQEREKEYAREKECERDQAREREMENDKDKEEPHADLADARHGGGEMNIEPEEVIAEAEPMDVDAVDISSNLAASNCIITDSDVMVLNGHTSEVCLSAWSPSGLLLASGSGDSTARIWTINEGLCSSNMQGVLPSYVELDHSTAGIALRKDVTSLDWNSEATLLASGCSDGHTRIWSRDGELVNTFNRHRGPIFSLKWNKRGDYLLCGCLDRTASVWDMTTGELRQHFKFHSGSVLDVDWRDDVSFATCSSDKMIYVCKVGENRAIKTFSGHQAEVNAVKWDPTGQLLASCSDDSTAKIWSMRRNTCLQELKEHTMEIFTIKWSPTGPGTNNPNQHLLLASASFDSTVKLWDVESGSLIYSLNGHVNPIYAIAFSPNGDYIASGSIDKCLHVWSVKEARIVKTYVGHGAIFDISWNEEGDKIAAAYSNNAVCVMDFRM